MDTVVYPNEAVREMSRAFVCVRVEHDKRPDLVKQYGVKALADLRLLDADGNERDHMVGFTGAPKLVARCQTMLDRLAGHEPPAGESRAAPAQEIRLTKESLELARTRGLAYLRAEAKRGWAHSSPGLGPDE